jgi:hypothetical protein
MNKGKRRIEPRILMNRLKNLISCLNNKLSSEADHERAIHHVELFPLGIFLLLFYVKKVNVRNDHQ